MWQTKKKTMDKYYLFSFVFVSWNQNQGLDTSSMQLQGLIGSEWPYLLFSTSSPTGTHYCGEPEDHDGHQSDGHLMKNALGFSLFSWQLHCVLLSIRIGVPLELAVQVVGKSGGRSEVWEQCFSFKHSAWGVSKLLPPPPWAPGVLLPCCVLFPPQNGGGSTWPGAHAVSLTLAEQSSGVSHPSVSGSVTETVILWSTKAWVVHLDPKAHTWFQLFLFNNVYSI